MRRLYFTLAVWLAGAVLLAAPAVRAAEFGDLVITAETVFGDSAARGYTEYRVNVLNRSAARAHDVRLIIPGEGYPGRGNWIGQLTRSLRVEPAAAVVVSLLHPPLPLYGTGMTVVIDGETQPVLVSLDSGQGGPARFGSVSDTPHVLISQAVNTAGFGTHAHQQLTTEQGEPNLAYSGADLPLTNWSTHWLTYARYDGVAVTAEDWARLAPAVRAALWRYVQCGGSLFVAGAWEAPPPWRSRQERGVALPTYNVGFGQSVTSGAAPLARLSAEQWQHLMNSWQQTRKTQQYAQNRDVAEANKKFPVVEKLGVPVRGLFLLMLLFVVVIGPLNLFILARKRKKLWLLWTVPAVSLITCLAVSAYTIFAEGWSGHARSEGLTVLDEVAHEAVTIGWTAFYTPLTPGEGLHFSPETELMPQVPFYYYSGGTNQPRDIDWTRDQHLAAGWVTARVPAHFMVRKVEPRRERLALKRGADGSLGVVNGLGADVRQLWLADKEGRVYSAADIRAGAQAVLTPTGRRAAGDAGGLRQAFASDWLSSMDLAAKPELHLMPGCYIATLATNPFMEEGLGDIDDRKTAAVVYGIMGEP